VIAVLLVQGLYYKMFTKDASQAVLDAVSFLVHLWMRCYSCSFSSHITLMLTSLSLYFHSWSS
jgi:hypothetical protein